MLKLNMNLKQISNISGFSISTVSKALNGKSDISSKTKNAIKKIAKDYNYVPNYTALSFRRQKSNTLAVIVPHLADACIAQFLSEIQKLSFFYNYRLLFYQSFSSYKNELQCIKHVNNGSTDGVIVLSKNNKHILPTKLDIQHNTPMVIINIEEIKGAKFNFDAKVSKYFNDLLLEIN